MLTNLLQALDGGKTPPSPLVADLARLLPAYVTAQHRHHAHEEAAIWPAAAALDAEALAQIAAEMKARRARLGSGAAMKVEHHVNLTLRTMVVALALMVAVYVAPLVATFVGLTVLR